MRNDDVYLQLYIVRHAESMSNAHDAAPICEPNFDLSNPPLSELGHKQASALGERLRPLKIDAAYVSTYRRALQTSAEILKYHSDTAVTYTPDIVEKDTAVLENGFEYKEESDAECLKRAESFLRMICEKHRSKENVLIVTHGGFIEFLMFAALNSEYSPQKSICVYNSSVTKLKFYYNSKVKVAVLNDISHLSSLDGDKLFWM